MCFLLNKNRIEIFAWSGEKNKRSEKTSALRVILRMSAVLIYSHLQTNWGSKNGFQRYLVRVYHCKPVENKETDSQLFCRWETSYVEKYFEAHEVRLLATVDMWLHATVDMRLLETVDMFVGIYACDSNHQSGEKIQDLIQIY
jgi:hypothetical protein